MSVAKVLVVDDSITMRALFSDVLERTKGIEVVGAARDANEARDMIEDLNPNVVTLDVEMPGMNGLDFLAEIMSTNPLPVVMLSTRTGKGAETSLRAFELGAVECFPKPQHATPDEFDKIASTLGKLVLSVANHKVTAPGSSGSAGFTGTFVWDGTLVALSASTGGIEAITEVLRGFPENCPPTIALLRIDGGFVAPFAAKLSEAIKPVVKIAAEGMLLEQGTVYLAADPTAHVVVDQWPNGRIRFLDREPVQGFKPSASLLYASMAKAGGKLAGAVLTGMGNDGAQGIKALKAAGGKTFAQDKETSIVSEAPSCAVETGAIDQVLPLPAISGAILKACQEAA